MKSKNALIGMAILFVALAALASAIVWNDIAFAAKVGMYAFGFSTGIAAGTLIANRRNQPTD